jgi:hypothetical protein
LGGNSPATGKLRLRRAENGALSNVGQGFGQAFVELHLSFYYEVISEN